MQPFRPLSPSVIHCQYKEFSIRFKGLQAKIYDLLGPNGGQTVITVEIHPDQPNRQPVAFRLQDPEKELKEPKFQGTNVWFGQLTLIGDLVD